MAGRPKKPIQVHMATGNKSRLTKAEIERREKTELQVDLKDIQCPPYITGNLESEFWEIADKLLHIGIMTELDQDLLGRYLIAKELWLNYTARITKALKEGDTEEAGKLMTQQDRAFKQCRACGNDLGLSISSRCRLVLPEAEGPKVNKFLEKFGGG